MGPPPSADPRRARRTPFARRQRRGKLFVGLMMVDHDRIEAELARLRERLGAHRAAVDRHQEARASRRERADCVYIGPIALEQPIGDVDDWGKPAMAQISS